MNYQYILFDLDGTLTDPKVGITKSVAYALNKMGYSDINLDDLTKFIGPPLHDSFSEYYQMDDEKVKQAVTYYREYFKDKGIYENEVYDGIEGLLKALKDEGKTIAVATSKPTVFAEVIIKHFHLEPYFSYIAGSNLDGTRIKKAEVIEYVMETLEISNKDSIIMIGDREHDIIGAKQNGIDSVGVEYGYGTKDELEKAGATYIVDRVKDLKTLLMK